MLNLAYQSSKKKEPAKPAPKPKAPPKGPKLPAFLEQKALNRSTAAETGISSDSPLLKAFRQTLAPKAPAPKGVPTEDQKFKAFQQSVGVKNPPKRPSPAELSKRSETTRRRGTPGTVEFVMSQLDKDKRLNLTPEDRELAANVLRFRAMRPMGDGQYDPEIRVNVFDANNIEGRVRNDDVIEVLSLLRKKKSLLVAELDGHRAQREAMSTQVAGERLLDAAGLSGKPAFQSAPAGSDENSRRNVQITESGQLVPFDPYDESYVGQLKKNAEKNSKFLDAGLKPVTDVINFAFDHDPLTKYNEAVLGQIGKLMEGVPAQKALEPVKQWMKSWGRGGTAFAQLLDPALMSNLQKVRREFISKAPSTVATGVLSGLASPLGVVDRDPRIDQEHRFWDGLEAVTGYLGAAAGAGVFKAGKMLPLLAHVDEGLKHMRIRANALSAVAHEAGVAGYFGDKVEKFVTKELKPFYAEQAVLAAGGKKNLLLASVEDIPRAMLPKKFLATGMHEAAIAEAIQRGKKIDPEVLKDYPGLDEGIVAGDIRPADLLIPEEVVAAKQTAEELPALPKETAAKSEVLPEKVSPPEADLAGIGKAEATAKAPGDVKWSTGADLDRERLDDLAAAKRELGLEVDHQPYKQQGIGSKTEQQKVPARASEGNEPNLEEWTAYWNKSKKYEGEIYEDVIPDMLQESGSARTVGKYLERTKNVNREDVLRAVQEAGGYLDEEDLIDLTPHKMNILELQEFRELEQKLNVLNKEVYKYKSDNPGVDEAFWNYFEEGDLDTSISEEKIFEYRNLLSEQQQTQYEVDNIATKFAGKKEGMINAYHRIVPWYENKATDVETPKAKSLENPPSTTERRAAKSTGGDEISRATVAKAEPVEKANVPAEMWKRTQAQYLEGREFADKNAAIAGHKREVRKALEAGEDVPEEVRASYPDLDAKYPKREADFGSTRPTQEAIEEQRRLAAEAAGKAEKKAGETRSKYGDMQEAERKAKSEPADTMTKEEVKREAVKIKVVDRQSFEDGVRKIFNLPDDEMAAVMAMNDARAKGWASGKAGRKWEDWYAKTWDSVSNGVDEFDLSVMQGKKGAVKFLADRKAILVALTKPDVSTVMHEIGHVFRQQLPPEVNAILSDHYDLPVDYLKMPPRAVEVALENQPDLFKKLVAAEEDFARQFERWLRDGETVHAPLQKVFVALRDWFSEIYKSLKGSPIEKDIHPKLRDIFERLTNEKGIGADYDPTAGIRISKKAKGGTSVTFDNRLYELTTRENKAFERLTVKLQADMEFWQAGNPDATVDAKRAMMASQRERMQAFLDVTEDFQRKTEKFEREKLREIKPEFSISGGKDIEIGPTHDDFFDSLSIPETHAKVKGWAKAVVDANEGSGDKVYLFARGRGLTIDEARSLVEEVGGELTAKLANETEEGTTFFQKAEPEKATPAAKELDDLGIGGPSSVQEQREAVGWLSMMKAGDERGSLDMVMSTIGSPTDRLRNIGSPGNINRQAGVQLADDIEFILNRRTVVTSRLLKDKQRITVKHHGGKIAEFGNEFNLIPTNWGVKNKAAKAAQEELAKKIHRGDIHLITEPYEKELHAWWTATNARLVNESAANGHMIDVTVGQILKPKKLAAEHTGFNPAELAAMESENFWMNQEVFWYGRDANGTMTDRVGEIIGIEDRGIRVRPYDTNEAIFMDETRIVSRVSKVDPERYFPRVIKKEVMDQIDAKKGPYWDIIEKKMIDYISEGNEEAARRYLDAAESVKKNEFAKTRIMLERMTNEMFGKERGTVYSAQVSRVERQRLPYVLPEEFYDFDFDKVTTGHIQNAIGRIVEAERWGNDNYGLMKLAGQTGTEANGVLKTVKLALGHSEAKLKNDAMLRKMTKADQTWQVLSKLTGGMTVLKQIPQLASTGGVLGVRNTIKGIFKDMLKPEYMQSMREIAETGIAGDGLEYMYFDDMGEGLKNATELAVTATGIKPVDTVLRYISARAGRVAVERAIAELRVVDGQIQRYRDLKGAAALKEKIGGLTTKGFKLGKSEVKPVNYGKAVADVIPGYLSDRNYDLLREWFNYTDEDILEMKQTGVISDRQMNMAYHGGAKTQVRTRTSDIPEILQGHEVMRMATRLKSFAFGQARILTYAANEATKGNLKPLIRMTAGYSALGYVTDRAIKHLTAKMTNKEVERDYKDWVTRLAWGAINGGIGGVFTDGIDGAEYAFKEVDQMSDEDRASGRNPIPDALAKSVGETTLPPILSDFTKAIKTFGKQWTYNTSNPLVLGDDFLRSTVVLYGRLAKIGEPDEKFIKIRRKEVRQELKKQGFSNSYIESFIEKNYQLPPPRWATEAHKKWLQDLRENIDLTLDEEGKPVVSKGQLLDRMIDRPDPYDRPKKK